MYPKTYNQNGCKSKKKQNELVRHELSRNSAETWDLLTQNKPTDISQYNTH